MKVRFLPPPPNIVERFQNRPRETSNLGLDELMRDGVQTVEREMLQRSQITVFDLTRAGNCLRKVGTGAESV